MIERKINDRSYELNFYGKTYRKYLVHIKPTEESSETFISKQDIEMRREDLKNIRTCRAVSLNNIIKQHKQHKVSLNFRRSSSKAICAPKQHKGARDTAGKNTELIQNNHTLLKTIEVPSSSNQEERTT